MTGGIAGLNAVVLTYPLDLVRARMTFRVDPKVAIADHPTAAIQKSRPTVLGTLISVAKNEGGIAGLYRGLTPAVIFVLPYSATNFYAFETIKYQLITKCSKWCTEENNGEHVLNIPSKFLTGGMAGSFFLEVIVSNRSSTIFLIRCMCCNHCIPDRRLSATDAIELCGRSIQKVFKRISEDVFIGIQREWGCERTLSWIIGQLLESSSSHGNEFYCL